MSRRKIDPDAPWPIRNALGLLREQQKAWVSGGRGRDAPADYRSGVELALEFAISVVESINVVIPPRKVPLREEARNAVTKIIRHFGEFLVLAGGELEHFGQAVFDYDYDDGS